jgi:hypothetical protein
MVRPFVLVVFIWHRRNLKKTFNYLYYYLTR